MKKVWIFYENILICMKEKLVDIKIDCEEEIQGEMNDEFNDEFDEEF